MPISPYAPAGVQGDANAMAAGLGRLGLILASLLNGKVDGAWELEGPADLGWSSASLTAHANRTGATNRPVFIVQSATEAISLQKVGAFAKWRSGHPRRRDMADSHRAQAER